MGRIAGVSAEETKERLVDAAARIFELKGYEGATVAQIAREAGVTTGAIYAHYSSKAELLIEALRVHSERATASLLPPGARAEAPDLLLALGSRLGRDDRDESALLIEALLAARRDAELAQVLAAALGDRERLMASILADGQAQRLLTEDVPVDAAARFALMLGLGSLLVRALDLPPVDRAQWDQVIRGLVDAFSERAGG